MNTNNLKKTILGIGILAMLLVSMVFASAISVDADYITIYPGEQGKVTLDIENTENFDIEEVTAQIILATTLPDGTIVSLPFTVIGSSEKDVDDIDEEDNEKVDFTIKASTNIEPGDYNIPYQIEYVNAEDNTDDYKKQGTFAIRVSAKTEIDYSLEVNENPIIGQKGKISLEIINKGLGEIKSVSIEIIPQGFELLSAKKIFIGTINAEDTDLAGFDVIYNSKNTALNAKITYKDFDNKEQTQTVNLPVKVYTNEEALELGLIQKSKTGIYVGIVIILIIIWFVYRSIKKRRKKKKKSENNGGN